MTGYAVVDVETTGLFPGGHDRIAEIAIVQVDSDGRMSTISRAPLLPMPFPADARADLRQAGRMDWGGELANSADQPFFRGLRLGPHFALRRCA